MVKRYNIDWDNEPLGKVYDAVIADKHGVHVSVVTRQRQARGIMACRKKRYDIDWDRQPLGEVPDRVIAKRLGMCTSVVGRHRAKRKIPAVDDIKSGCAPLANTVQRSKASWLMLPPEPHAACARCGYRKKDVRFDENDAGYICKPCYLFAKACKRKGCDKLALGTGLCRDHYVGDTWDEEQYRQLAEHLGWYGNSRFTEPDPAARGFNVSEFGDLLSERLRQMGKVVKQSPGSGPLIWVTGEKK